MGVDAEDHVVLTRRSCVVRLLLHSHRARHRVERVLSFAVVAGALVVRFLVDLNLVVIQWLARVVLLLDVKLDWLLRLVSRALGSQLLSSAERPA